MRVAMYYLWYVSIWYNCKYQLINKNKIKRIIIINIELYLAYFVRYPIYLNSIFSSIRGSIKIRQYQIAHWNEQLTTFYDEYEIKCYSTSNSINKLVPARQRQRREITAGANGVGSPVTVKTAADCSFVELSDDCTVIERQMDERRKGEGEKEGEQGNELGQFDDEDSQTRTEPDPSGNQ